MTRDCDHFATYPVSIHLDFPGPRRPLGVARGLLRRCQRLDSLSAPSLSKQEKSMNLTRAIFLALAVLVPTSWTIAKAEDAPAADAPAKKEKKAKKKKADKEEKKDDKKAM